MNYEEIRTLLTDYFGRMLEAQKQTIHEDGHLSPLAVEGFKHVASGAIPTSLREHVQRDAVDGLMVNDILEGLGISNDLPDDARRRLVSEYRRADAAYARAVLDYDQAYGRYRFSEQPEIISVQPAKRSSARLSGVVAEFWKYAKIENRWIAKTEGEKLEHIDLLYEVLGRDKPIAEIDHESARRVRDTLAAYPVNRNKNKRTKGKTLDELQAITGLRTLHPLSINKYMQTYSGLFNWAKRNGYCSENPFEGLSLRTEKANKEAPRLPFPATDLKDIKRALLDPGRDIQPHHKWGTLIAMHTGARLNEVAQLHLDDLRQIDGIWCFDINDNGLMKKLKNQASKRVVPVHPALLENGLMEYVSSVRADGNNRLFPRLTYSASDGYGRNLGRWFNEAFLPSLGLKTKQCTFHSLRHSMIERLIAADVAQAHVMAIVGHEPGTTTLRTYNRTGFPPSQLLEALRSAL